MGERRPRVHHVGRAGDIPGGMTQVVNAYLAWPFAHVDVDVIASRGNPGDHVAAARGFARAMRAVRAIARSGHPSVIVVHLSERGSFLREGTIARYAARQGLPVIAHLHGSEFAAFERAQPNLVGKVLAAAHHVISLSEETSGICARHIGADRVSLVPNAIPEGAPTEKLPTVVFGGVVSHRKGIDVLQDAWRAAAPAAPWRLVVAGPIRDEHLVDRSVPGIEFVGSLGHDELMAALDSAAIAVLPSRDEAMPMFILEALARRCAVVSTTVGGIPGVLCDGAGLMTEPGDAAGLADALRTLTGDDAAREEVAAAGLDRFRERFAAASVFPRVEAIWLDALREAMPDTPATRRRSTTQEIHAS